MSVTTPDGASLTEANSLSEAEGVLRSEAVGERAMRGRGYNEFVGGALELSKRL